MVVRFKSSCPIFAGVDQLDIGREGLMSIISGLTILIYVLLWILRTCNDGGGIDSVPCLDMAMARASVIYLKIDPLTRVPIRLAIPSPANDRHCITKPMC